MKRLFQTNVHPREQRDTNFFFVVQQGIVVELHVRLHPSHDGLQFHSQVFRTSDTQW